MVRECWDAFRDQHGDRVAKIFAKFEELSHSSSLDQTVGQRQKLFERACKEIFTIVRLWLFTAKLLLIRPTGHQRIKAQPL